jgi:phosphonate transport system substrate-binding protein
MKRSIQPISLILGIFSCVLLQNVRATTAGEAAVKTKPISLGFVSKRSQAEVEPQFRDFVNYVARKLSAPGAAIEGKFVVAPSPLQLAKLVDEKKVDFYSDSPYPTYLINKQGSASLLLRRWRGGMAEYHSVIFAKKDGGPARLEDLRGKMIAFEDPGSTSGHFLPKVFLLTKGFKLAEKPSVDAKVAPKEIGYTFTYSTDKIVEGVLAGKVAAGAFSNDDYGRLDEKGKAQIAILAETESFPRNLVSVRKDLDPKTVNRLKEILLAMDQDAEGKQILEKFDHTTKFDLLPGGEESVRRKITELFRPHEKH